MPRGLTFALLLGLLVVPCANAVRSPAPVRADIQVRIDPETRELAGKGAWTVPPGESLAIVLDDRFDVRRFTVDGQARPTEPKHDGRRHWRLAQSERTARRVEIEWRGPLDPLEAGLDHRQVLRHTVPVTAPRGTFLPGAAEWHPVFTGRPLQYTLHVDLPLGQCAVVAGNLVSDRSVDGRRLQAFQFEQPGPVIDLMAGPYRVVEREFAALGNRSITLRTLFHAEIADLAAGYLDATERYLRLYERWIGPYPYGSFSIISSPTPTGFGMPTLTYLGIDVLRLPFIRDTSLGHEVLHNWWGNGVYPDYARGNWSEGLTTLMADYAYKEREGEAAARAMRLEWLRDFAAVPPGGDTPLAAFTSRTHGASQIVGYHKAAMLFLMLRDRIGADAFDLALQAFWRDYRFRVAGWSDLRVTFEQAAREPLGSFFTQWLTRSGAPALRIERAANTPQRDGWRTEVTLAQSAPPYQVRVPLVFRTPRGDETRWVTLEKERQTFAIALDLEPTAVLLDPDFRVFRRLAPEEAPPILRQVMLDASTATVIVSGGEAESAARDLAARLQEHAPRFAGAELAPPAAPTLVVGLTADVDRWLQRHGLPPRPAPVAGKGTAQVWTQARERAGPLAIVSADDTAALAALARPLPHHGRQSYIAFDGAKVVERGVWPGQALQQRLR